VAVPVLEELEDEDDEFLVDEVVVSSSVVQAPKANVVAKIKK